MEEAKLKKINEIKKNLNGVGKLNEGIILKKWKADKKVVFTMHWEKCHTQSQAARSATLLLFCNKSL